MKDTKIDKEIDDFDEEDDLDSWGELDEEF